MCHCLPARRLLGLRRERDRVAGPRAARRGDQLFTQLPSSATGVRFENRLEQSKAFNVFTYRNFYNGGGAAIGDLTGDGLPEIVLTSNETRPAPLPQSTASSPSATSPRPSGITSAQGFWTTGVAIADVNSDGRLDIYISKAGQGEPAARANELWINQGVDRTACRPSRRWRASTASPTKGTPPRRRSSTTTATAISICSS